MSFLAIRVRTCSSTQRSTPAFKTKAECRFCGTLSSLLGGLTPGPAAPPSEPAGEGTAEGAMEISSNEGSDIGGNADAAAGIRGGNGEPDLPNPADDTAPPRLEGAESPDYRASSGYALSCWPDRPPQALS